MLRAPEGDRAPEHFLAQHVRFLAPCFGLATRVAAFHPELARSSAGRLEMEDQLVAELASLWGCDADETQARLEAFEPPVTTALFASLVEGTLEREPLAAPAALLVVESVLARVRRVPWAGWWEPLAKLGPSQASTVLSVARIAATCYRELYRALDDAESLDD